MPTPSNEDAVERSLREEVAACTLMLNDLGILGYSGHVSARRADGRSLLIQSFDQSRSELGPDDLLTCDLDGRTLAGPDGLKPPSEVFIHCEILRARSDVNAVAHFHHDLATTFTLVEGVTLAPIKNHAVRWSSGIPVHPDPSHVSNPALGRAVARALGPHHALLIRAHGQVVAAENVRALLIDCVHFVENAEAMYRAASLGRVLPLTAKEIEDFLADFDRDRHVYKLWKYYAGRGRASGLLPEDWAL
ncbi:MAG TPA: class II aldolase/adducin family protein [Stellaceae bacterium]|nr:class II aldolase/adducin family protein [Stellaceae bacterium]